MRFLIDAQLPPQLANWLVKRGHEAWHVLDFDLADRPDVEVFAKAVQLNCIIVTKDADFARLLEAQRVGQVLWLRWGNSTARSLVHGLDSIWPDVETALADGQVLVEVSRRLHAR